VSVRDPAINGRTGMLALLRAAAHCSTVASEDAAVTRYRA
jgi:hypothetical protein